MAETLAQISPVLQVLSVMKFSSNKIALSSAGEFLRNLGRNLLNGMLGFAAGIMILDRTLA